ncbi:MAG: hypothetical protein MJ186_05670 [Clostridia bacterium]|nr:hypothetical protein [Clostridia bacterium]
MPAGKQAVLSFDYDYLSESGGCSSVYINIARDGVAAPWEKICSDTTWNTGSGTYVHPQILGPGTYTISSVVRDYTSSSKHTNYFYMDNLRVCHVKAGAPVSADLAPAKSSRVSEVSGGMYHVSGSFVTPPKTLSFGRYDCEYASGVNNSYASYSDVLSGYSKTVTETITIPSGRKALYSAFTFTGKGARYSSRDYNVFWTLDGAYAGAYYPSPSGSDYLYVVPSPYKSVARGLTGSHVYKATANTRYGTAAGAAGLELYISKAGAAIPESINAGKFIVNSGKLYGLSSEYSGAAKLAFSPAEGTVIRNFKLYTISGGRKVYAEEFFFKDEADAQRWTASGCKAAIGANRTEKEEPARVYAKGETVNYQVFYSDYEADPSKAQFWQYEHEPMNDGLHPKAGQILSASIPKFYVDGKYTVTHWQQDNTGVPAFDKDSNKVSITFYIQGGAQSAPWVKYIKTDPAKVDGGDKYTIAAAVDDEEKDTLSVKIEVYKDGAAKPFATKNFTSLNADASGNYPVLKLTDLPNAQPGTYDVIVTVKDESAAGMDSYRFKVKEVKSVTGAVAHTPEWEANRLEWNKVKKGTSAERPANMFWPGEALVLSSKTGGKPSYVTAKLVEFPQFSVRLTRKSENADGTENYEGQLWNAGMLAAIGTTKAVPATVRFTAVYPDGSSLNCDVKIVFDQTQGSYYQLHRRY